ncbi:MFS transporter [Roseomonas elaeocarpi]|uniref:MFS transporter n=1 Tax=Roseomonas elaeocarpi TaxID=907779 RepID=A0ABV6JMQ8_9PROT
MVITGLAHAFHDGLTSSIYLLMPLWQAQLGLNYSALALLRALYIGTLAGLQIPSGRLGRRMGIPAVLGIGTVLSGCAFALSGLSGGVLSLGATLVLAGAGGSTQHPLASAAVSRAYGSAARGPLGLYNFAGDLGKASLPPLLAVAMGPQGWHPVFWAVAVLGAVVAFVILRLMPRSSGDPISVAPAVAATAKAPGYKGRGRGFVLLIAIALFDGCAGVALLLFLPALMQMKGGTPATLGLALSLIFVGGACGKAVCGWLGNHLGLVMTVIVTEIGTTAAVMALLALPLVPALALLPILGIMLNGTSSVLYGTVPELAPPGRIEHAFALFYSCTLGSSALAPVLYGWLGDTAGPRWAVIVAGATALAVVPLMILLAPILKSLEPTARS